MMMMMESGGIPPLTDRIRAADEDNPLGYYEFERVKNLPDGDTAWLAEAQGKAVKVIAALLPFLPDGYEYRILFMRRRMTEILASQRKMLLRRGENPDERDDEEIARLFVRYLQGVEDWLAAHPNARRLDISYNALLRQPQAQLERIQRFLGVRLDLDAMVARIDTSLYRNR